MRESGALTVSAAEHRLGGHPCAFEDDLRGGLGIPAHLLFFGTETDTGSALFDDERRNATRTVAAGAGHHDVDIGYARPGDELLHAVEHVEVTVANGLGPQRAGVRACARFRQAVTGDGLHRCELGHPGLALLARAVRIDHPRAHVVDGQECRDGGVGGGQLFEDANGVDAAQPAAAGVFTAVDRRHAELGGLAQFVDRKVMRLVPFQCVWGKTLFGERGRRLGDHAFVVIQTEELHGCAYFIVGIENSAPWEPAGQRWVTVLTLV